MAGIAPSGPARTCRMPAATVAEADRRGPVTKGRSAAGVATENAGLDVGRLGGARNRATVREVDQRVRYRAQHHPAHRDRKMTCLNSSHANLTYAVFCLIKS